MRIRNNVIRDFDNFKSLNEEGEQSLYSFASGEIVKSVGDSIKGQVTKYVLDYFKIGDKFEPGSFGFFVRDIFVTTIEKLSLREMDDLLLGRQSIDDGEYWAEKIAKSTTYVLSKEVATSQIVRNLGFDPEGILGRILTHAIDGVIRDEKEVERLIKAAWNVLYRKQYIPDVDSGELYQKAVSKLTPEQKSKLSGKTLWGSSVRQADVLRGGRS